MQSRAEHFQIPDGRHSLRQPIKLVAEFQKIACYIFHKVFLCKYKKFPALFLIDSLLRTVSAIALIGSG